MDVKDTSLSIDRARGTHKSRSAAYSVSTAGTSVSAFPCRSKFCSLRKTGVNDAMALYDRILLSIATRDVVSTDDPLCTLRSDRMHASTVQRREVVHLDGRVHGREVVETERPVSARRGSDERP